MPLDLALGSLDFPEVEHHQAHVDGIGGDANNAEIIEHKEQDPGQVDRTSERQQGTQQQQEGCPAAPEATCKEEKLNMGFRDKLPLETAMTSAPPRQQGLLGKPLK